ncbi:multicopper oxidase domain-containing protein [Paraburkholderia xenovorans]|uniref:multicopper oxidase family protein n=1 Tax=Paraburkholderia xenovorans TaxID=36873 RepID=UPI0038B92665
MSFSQSRIKRQLNRIACVALMSLCSVISWNGIAQNKAAPTQQSTPQIDLCPRPAVGSAVPEPVDLRSSHGVLKLDLTIQNVREPDGSVRYCYTTPSGAQAPTLRVHPGDRVVLRLKNNLKEIVSAAKPSDPMAGPICSAKPRKVSNPCDSDVMTATSTNLHFHGMTMPPVCHQDDVLKTSIQPDDGVFEYNFQVPRNEPPGLYWYHPHVHGFSSEQVGGGASGALIVEGIERAIPDVAALPERVLVIRDQELLHPDAPPNKSEPPALAKAQLDNDGDTQNTGTGFGKPSKDLSVNFVPVPYPNYEPATIRIKPGQRQLWRVLNSSSVTYLNLALLYQHKPQSIGIVAIDGVPKQKEGNGAIPWVDHIGIPPASRVEFIMNGPPPGVTGLLVTRTVDTGPAGENDPNRALVLIKADPQAPELASTLPAAHSPLPADKLPPLRDVKPVRTRKLFFTEIPSNPNDPNSPTDFYITVEGQKPKLFDPHSRVPNITVHQGDVEDWIIENRSPELHAFHIHQIHFQVMEVNGHPVDEPFLRDTVNVPYFRSTELSYPSVRLRMDFRDPNVVGTFVYHCHLLEHEDGGMMGTVRVLPRGK